jgi:dual specificity tyrosine-phosphorylation-regulated kinase 1
VLQLLSSSLYDMLVEHHFEGFSLSLVRLLAWHILQALAFLARPDVDVIHCDLKPENIMLCHVHSPVIQVLFIAYC